MLGGGPDYSFLVEGGHRPPVQKVAKWDKVSWHEAPFLRTQHVAISRLLGGIFGKSHTFTSNMHRCSLASLRVMEFQQAEDLSKPKKESFY